MKDTETESGEMRKRREIRDRERDERQIQRREQATSPGHTLDLS